MPSATLGSPICSCQLHWHLRSQDYAPRLVTLTADFPKVPTFRFGERRHRPVVHDQHINAADPQQEMTKVPSARAGANSGRSAAAGVSNDSIRAGAAEGFGGSGLGA